jgi:hypothetical protein
MTDTALPAVAPRGRRKCSELHFTTFDDGRLSAAEVTKASDTARGRPNREHHFAKHKGNPLSKSLATAGARSRRRATGRCWDNQTARHAVARTAGTELLDPRRVHAGEEVVGCDDVLEMVVHGVTPDVRSVGAVAT